MATITHPRRSECTGSLSAEPRSVALGQPSHVPAWFESPWVARRFARVVVLLGVALGWGAHARAQQPVVEITGVLCQPYIVIQAYCQFTSGGCSVWRSFGLDTPGIATCSAVLPPPCPSTLVARGGSALTCAVLRADENDPGSVPIGLVIDKSVWIERPTEGYWPTAEAGFAVQVRFVVHPPGTDYVVDHSGEASGGVYFVDESSNQFAQRPLPPGQYRLDNYGYTLSGSRTGRTTITFTSGSVGFGSGSAATAPIPPDASGCFALGGSSAWVAAPASPRLRLTFSEPPSPPGTRFASLTLPTGLVNPARIFADGLLLGEFAPGETLNIGALMGTSGASVVEISGVQSAAPGISTLPLWLSHTGQSATVCIESLPCTADFNGDGSVEVPDIFAFLAAWFAQDSSADFDGNTLVQVPDIFAFLSEWFAGCP